MHHPHSAAPSDVPPSLVRAELDRILASEIFSRSDRLSAFLKFIVDETLDGHGDTLKEQVIAVELYGKGADFNTAADPIVRVEARRLRDKLREYYASAPHGLLAISVPKGSYTPVFQLKGLSAGSPADVRQALVEADPAVVLPPSGPATPVIAIPTSACNARRAPRAIATATGALTAPCCLSNPPGKPHSRCM